MPPSPDDRLNLSGTPGARPSVRGRLTAPRALLLVLSVTALVAAAALTVLGLSSGAPGTAAASPTTSQPTATASATPDSQKTGAPPTYGPTPSPQPTPTPTPIKEVGATSLPPTELTGYSWPLRNALITSRFAPRDFGGFLLIDGEEVHDGLDLATHCGDKIRAAHDGTVLYAGRNFDVFLGYRGHPEQIYARYERQGRVNALPIVIVVDDGNGYRSIYVHLSRADVEAGAVIRAGDIIGAEGMTGYATGCHLHYGLIRMDGGWQDLVPRLARYGYPLFVRERIDPLQVLPWDDQYAPQRLRDRAGASPTPSTNPTQGASPTPIPSPSSTPIPTP